MCTKRKLAVNQVNRFKPVPKIAYGTTLNCTPIKRLARASSLNNHETSLIIWHSRLYTKPIRCLKSHSRGRLM